MTPSLFRVTLTAHARRGLKLLLTLACAHAQRGLLQLVFTCVCMCMCVCVRASVRLSVRLSTVFLGNRGNSERETWTYYQVGGMHGKIRFWSGEGRGSW